MARTRQAAVVPYRIRKARVEVALVTTSTGRGWIVPKGSVEAGERPRHAAQREAEEEAGLLGVVARKPLGRYRHVNGHGACRVDVYLMRVTAVLEHWLEDRWRRRRWMRVADAAERVPKGLRPLVHDLEAVLDMES
jgi:8-oxo-dGTP pyrophosphatase MutT (NUDIX family)